MPLKEMILDESTDITAIGEYLDGLLESEQEVEILSLNKTLQRSLYAKAEGVAPLTVDHFATVDGGGVVHQGRRRQHRRAYKGEKSMGQFFVLLAPKDR